MHVRGVVSIRLLKHLARLIERLMCADVLLSLMQLVQIAIMSDWLTLFNDVGILLAGFKVF